jgi:hypothetical protein
VITTDKKAGRHAVICYNGYWYPSPTTSKIILFYTGISALEKKVRFIFECPLHLTDKNKQLHCWYGLNSEKGFS